jgi:anthranilate synthase component 1
LIRPSLEEFLAMRAGASIVPVTCEVVADAITPVGAYAALAGGPGTYLLESVVGGEKWGRYSFVGLGPDLHARGRGDLFSLSLFPPSRDLFSPSNAAGGGRGEGGGEAAEHEHSPEDAPETTIERNVDPWRRLREILAARRAPHVPWLPRFWGGAVGYVSYDAVRAFEPTALGPDRRPESDRDDSEPPTERRDWDFSFAIGGPLVVFDDLRQTARAVVPVRTTDGEDPRRAYDAAAERARRIAARLSHPAALRAMAPPAPLRSDAPLPPSSFDRERFRAAVLRAKEHIRAGDVFQVVLSQRFRVPAAGLDAFDVYRALRAINPSPYMFFLHFGECRIAGASPETLVRLEGGKAEVRPIAGTRRRGATDEEDAAAEADLRADPKERAEHVMLVDLGRNDLGRVCSPGTVRVTETMAIERYSHVMHMTSNVTGELAPGTRRDRSPRRRVPRGHAQRRAEGARDADHRLARARGARHLRRRGRLRRLERQPRRRDRDPHARRAGRRAPRPGGRRDRRGVGPRRRVRRDRPQGPRRARRDRVRAPRWGMIAAHGDRHTMHRASFALLAASLAVACGPSNTYTPPEYCDRFVQPTMDDSTSVQGMFEEAQDGETLCFAPGTYTFVDPVSIREHTGVTLRGAGLTRGDVVLDFSTQMLGDTGVQLTMMTDVTIADLTIIGAPENNLSINDSTGVTIRNVSSGWRPGMPAGTYAIYPVTSTNVLIEDSEAFGSADAGIYVGQTTNCIVRNSVARLNVAGIEIENSTNCEVLENMAFDNTGGILVFELPGLDQQGTGTAVHDNVVRDNNTPNFAMGGIVAELPTGTGVMVLTANDVEIFANTITGNQSTGVLVASYETLIVNGVVANPMQPTYDHFIDGVWIHDNTFMSNGSMPAGLLGVAAAFAGVSTLEDVVWDGAQHATAPADDFCLQGNGTFRNGNGLSMFMMQSTDPTPFRCMRTPRPAVVLP